MAKAKRFMAKAVYSDGNVVEGKVHKEARRCYEELKLMLNKLSPDGLIYIGVEKVNNDKEES